MAPRARGGLPCGRRFLGGVHPVSYKESTRRKPIMPLEESPKQVAIPLTMCTGGGAVPVVKPGDKVTVGQVIAKPEEGGVYVHSSVSGRVRAIEPRPHPWGGRWTPSSSTMTARTPPVPTCRAHGLVPDGPGPGAGAHLSGGHHQHGGWSQPHPPAHRPVGGPGGHPDRQRRRVRTLSDGGPPAAAGARGPGAPVGPDALPAAAGRPGGAGGGGRQAQRRGVPGAPPAPEAPLVELVTIETRYPLGMEKTAGAHHHRPGGAPGPVGRGCEVRRVQCGHRLYGSCRPFGGAARHPPGGHSERRGRSPAPEPVGAHRNPSALPAGVGGGSEGGAGHYPHRRPHDRDGPDGSGGPGGEKHQRPAVPDQAGARRRGSAGDGVRPVRALRLLLPHEPEPGLCLPGHAHGESRSACLSSIWRTAWSAAACSYICPSHIPLADLVRQARTILAEGGEQA